MPRHPALSRAAILARLNVDTETGRCVWLTAAPSLQRLVGKEAGCAQRDSHGSMRWVIKLDGIPYKRAQLVLAVATGRWPEETVDHLNGKTLDDRAANLRHASGGENSKNRHRHTKKASTPMGVRGLPSGRFQARITRDGVLRTLGTHATQEQALMAYHQERDAT